MSGRSGGRHIGRTGPRIGLPVEPSRTEGRSDLRAGARGGWSPDPALGSDPRRDGGNAWKPSAPGRAEAGRHAERLSITQLFEHMEPRPRSYRDDAYEDAPKIAHPASRGRNAASFATMGALIGGATLSIFIIFVAGFLSAVLIFGEPDEGGELAIRTAPMPAQERTQAGAAGVSGSERDATPGGTAAENAGRSVVPSATAGREPLPAPSPEIAAAEAARQSALGEDNRAAAPAPVAAPTQPVTGSVIAAPQSGSLNNQTGPESTQSSSRGTGVVVTDAIIFPPSKPAEPPRQAVASAPPDGRLTEPSGNYSLQFGAFRDRGNAEALVREIARVAQGGIAEETGVSGTVLYYVRAGAFRTRAEALEAVRSLRDRTGIVTFVHANRGAG